MKLTLDPKFLKTLVIGSPKRLRRISSRGRDFFPYYAGFSEVFASKLLQSAGLPPNAVIYDPWNGSGTTTNTALRLGFNSYGTDLNPVMVLVARARNLNSFETEELLSLTRALIKNLKSLKTLPAVDDPLLQWFTVDTAKLLRNLERRIRKLSRNSSGDEMFDRISSQSASLYVALFTIAKKFTKEFGTSNPTWLKTPSLAESKIEIDPDALELAFVDQINGMVNAIEFLGDVSFAKVKCKIDVGNTTLMRESNFADFILTSPPYCTRIDYTAATRMELAIIEPILNKTKGELSREMIGSVRVPVAKIQPQDSWGKICLKFLKNLQVHDSKASRGYYYNTHLDYFDKMAVSIKNIARCLKPGGGAVFVVQNSHYKEIHNDVPGIVSEMAELAGLSVIRKVDFSQKNSIGKINSRSRKYQKSTDTVESVICFYKKTN